MIARIIFLSTLLTITLCFYAFQFLKEVLSKQPCEKLIVSPRRQIVHEGTLSNLDLGKACDMHVILFDDMLLLTRRKKGLTKKVSSSGSVVILIKCDLSHFTNYNTLIIHN